MAAVTEDLCIDNDYTINKEYPYTITKKSTGRVVTVSTNNEGYLTVSINGKTKLLHRLIALQWIPLSDDLLMFNVDDLEVDHKDKIRSNYHIENLEWVTRSKNLKNKLSYKNYVCDYVEHLSSNAIEVTSYGHHIISNLYYDNGEFYYKAYDTEYRRIEQNLNNNKKPALYISYRDINNARISITVNKFKKLFNIF